MQLRRRVGGLGMPFAGDPDEAASALARYVRKVIGDDGASPSTISSSPGVYSHSTHKFSVVEIGRLLKKVEFFRNLQLPHSIFDLIAHTFTVETFGASSHIDLKRDVGKVHLILDRSVTVCKRNGENSPQRLFPCVAGDCCGAGVCNRYSMLDDDAQGEASLLAETDSAKAHHKSTSGYPFRAYSIDTTFISCRYAVSGRHCASAAGICMLLLAAPSIAKPRKKRDFARSDYSVV